ncbi:hypothetical protein GOODEAATRI_005782 [Goodea atripinnis]|uniref:Uncharacterized protein n=1 Tax=Goodea atripinnis TaxID=208336 RepID=A0ABV0PBQ0_9TELE
MCECVSICMSTSRGGVRKQSTTGAARRGIRILAQIQSVEESLNELTAVSESCPPVPLCPPPPPTRSVMVSHLEPANQLSCVLSTPIVIALSSASKITLCFMLRAQMLIAFCLVCMGNFSTFGVDLCRGCDITQRQTE